MKKLVLLAIFIAGAMALVTANGVVKERLGVATVKTATTYDLELSKTLTLNPKGQAPAVEAAVSEPTKALSAWWVLTALGLGLLAAWLAYRFGRRAQQHDAQRLQLNLSKTQNENAQLKNTLAENGSGPRTEWQSSLTTIQKELREKSRIIDSLHDQSKHQLNLMTLAEQQLDDHTANVEALSQEHQKADEQRALKHEQALSEAQRELTQSEQMLEQAAKDLAAAQKQIDQLEQQATQQKQQSSKQHSEKAALETSLQSSQSETSRITQYNTELQGVIDRLQSEHETHLAERTSQQQELVNTTNRAVALEEKNRALEVDVQRHTEQQTELQNTIIDLEAQRDKQRIDALEKEKQSHAVTARLSQLEEEISALESANNDGASALQQQQETKLKLEAEVVNLNQQIEQMRPVTSKVEALQLDADGLRKELAQKQTALATTIEQLDSTQQQLAESSDQVLAFSEQLDSQKNVNDEYAQLKHEHAQLTSQLKELTTVTEEQNQLLDKFSSLADEHDITLETLHKAEAELDNSKQEHQAMLTLIDERDTQIQSLLGSKNDLDAMQQSFATLKATADENSKELEIARINYTQLNTVQSDYESLQEAHAELEIKAEAQALEVEKLKSQAEQLEQTQTNLMTLQESFENLEADTQTQSIVLAESAAEYLQDLESVRQQLKSKQTAVANLEQEQQVATQKISQLDQTNSRLQAALNDNETSIKDLVSGEEQLKADLAELNAQHLLLEEQHESAQAELEKTKEQLAHKTELLYARDGRLEEMASENNSHTGKVQQLEEQRLQFTDTINNLEKQLNEVERNQLKIDGELQESVSSATQEADKLSKKLEASVASKDSLNKQLADLRTQLQKAENEIDSKNLRVLKLGAELVEYKSRQEQYLQDLAAMEHKVADIKGDLKEQPDATEQRNLKAAIRARDNIVTALEHQMRESDEELAELKQTIENLQLSLVIGLHENKTGETEQDVDVGELQHDLAQRNQLIKKLHTDLKVHQDLVRVFESDSIQLQGAETQLSSLTETNNFLQEELTNAVNEVNLLKQQLGKAHIIAERRKNIGRTLSNDTKQHQQLLYKLAALEAENRQQLELINTLRTEDGLPN